MGFGFSGNLTRTWMVNADAVIAWVDVATGAPNAVDYYLTSRTPVSLKNKLEPQACHGNTVVCHFADLFVCLFCLFVVMLLLLLFSLPSVLMGWECVLTLLSLVRAAPTMWPIFRGLRIARGNAFNSPDPWKQVSPSWTKKLRGGALVPAFKKKTVFRKHMVCICHKAPLKTLTKTIHMLLLTHLNLILIIESGSNYPLFVCSFR